jgi:hypothetical protein
MKVQAYKFETGRTGAYRGDAGSILIVVYMVIVIFFSLLGSLSLL